MAAAVWIYGSWIYTEAQGNNTNLSQLTPGYLRGQSGLQLSSFQFVSETPEPMFLSLGPQVPWRTSPRPTDWPQIPSASGQACWLPPGTSDTGCFVTLSEAGLACFKHSVAFCLELAKSGRGTGRDSGGQERWQRHPRQTFQLGGPPPLSRHNLPRSGCGVKEIREGKEVEDQGPTESPTVTKQVPQIPQKTETELPLGSQKWD